MNTLKTGVVKKSEVLNYIKKHNPKLYDGDGLTIEDVEYAFEQSEHVTDEVEVRETETMYMVYYRRDGKTYFWLFGIMKPGMSNESNSLEDTKVSLFDVESADKFVEELKSKIDAPYVSPQVSTLGGKENVSILMRVSLTPENKWPEGIFHNSRYGIFHIHRNGTVENFSGNMTKRMRLSRAKSQDDVIAKINSYLTTQKEMKESVRDFLFGGVGIKDGREKFVKEVKVLARDEFKIGDVIDTLGRSNMADPVTIRKIEGNSVYFTDANGVEYSGFSRSILRNLIKDNVWKRVEPTKTEARMWSPTRKNFTAAYPSTRKCKNCGRKLPSSVQPGDSCMYCGKPWSMKIKEETTDQENISLSNIYHVEKLKRDAQAAYDEVVKNFETYEFDTNKAEYMVDTVNGAPADPFNIASIFGIDVSGFDSDLSWEMVEDFADKLSDEVNRQIKVKTVPGFEDYVFYFGFSQDVGDYGLFLVVNKSKKEEKVNFDVNKILKEVLSGKDTKEIMRMR